LGGPSPNSMAPPNPRNRRACHDPNESPQRLHESHDITLEKGITLRGKGSKDYYARKRNCSTSTGNDQAYMKSIENLVTIPAENHSSRHKGIIL
jgi:hypothetical protein